jgi:hypothetical protein
LSIGYFDTGEKHLERAFNLHSKRVVSVVTIMIAGTTYSCS